MRFASSFLLLTLLSSAILALVYAAPSSKGAHHYDVNTKVPIYASKIWPRPNPNEAFQIDFLPYCMFNKDSKNIGGQDLGKDISGSRMIELDKMDLAFRKQLTDAPLCKAQLNAKELKQFKDAVNRDFVMLWYYDGLPVFVPVGKKDKNTGHLYLSTHWDVRALFNGDQIVEIDIVDSPQKRIMLGSITEGTTVTFSYSTQWQSTNKEFSQRMNRILNEFSLQPAELEIHWFSVLNSLILVIVMTSFLAIIVRRILNRDYADLTSQTVIALTQEDAEDEREESGWKMLHGDVFRFPKKVNLLAALIGNGAQLLSLFLLFLALATVGIFYPDYTNSQMYTALIIIYTFTTSISGFVSQKVYLQLGGDRWVQNVLLTVALFVFPIALVWAVLNTIAVSYGSSSALSWKTVLGILALYFLVSFPLQLIGAITAKNFANARLDAPCRTKQVPRQVPAAPGWTLGGTTLVFFAGFLPFASIYIELYYLYTALWGNVIFIPYPILFLVFLILVVVTSCVSITMIYMQLSQEDHRWWWRSVWYGGSVAFFIAGYSVYFYHYETHMNGLLQAAFYFGYNAIVCYAFFLMMGAVAFFSCLQFIMRIFSVLRVD